MIVGPLLWHWENNNTNDLSIELDLEEVKALARKIGFEISVSPRTLSTSQQTYHSIEREDNRHDIHQ